MTRLGSLERNDVPLTLHSDAPMATVATHVITPASAQPRMPLKKPMLPAQDGLERESSGSEQQR